ncbi:MAG: hypothetical protein IJS71_00620 [Clostridia bacterium]|nr:hypothetical protein [Clostridia bacterium]
MKEFNTVKSSKDIVELKETRDSFGQSDSLAYLMRGLKKTDKLKVKEMAERILIREKYELLAKRGSF